MTEDDWFWIPSPDHALVSSSFPISSREQTSDSGIKPLLFLRQLNGRRNVLSVPSMLYQLWKPQRKPATTWAASTPLFMRVAHRCAEINRSRQILWEETVQLYAGEVPMCISTLSRKIISSKTWRSGQEPVLPEPCLNVEVRVVNEEGKDLGLEKSRGDCERIHDEGTGFPEALPRW